MNFQNLKEEVINLGAKPVQYSEVFGSPVYFELKIPRVSGQFLQELMQTVPDQLVQSTKKLGYPIVTLAVSDNNLQWCLDGSEVYDIYSAESEADLEKFVNDCAAYFYCRLGGCK